MTDTEMWVGWVKRVFLLRLTLKLYSLPAAGIVTAAPPRFSRKLLHAPEFLSALQLHRIPLLALSGGRA